MSETQHLLSGDDSGVYKPIQYSSPVDTIRGFFSRFRLCNPPQENLLDAPKGDYEEILDPEARALKYEKISTWMHTVCFIVTAIVCAGMGFIYLGFLLEPLLLARFSVYLFQPIINYLVGKKKIFHEKIRLKLPRSLAVLITTILAAGVLAALGMVLYVSIQQLFLNYDDYVANFHSLYEDIIQWLVDQGLSREQIEAMLPKFSVGNILQSIIEALPELFGQAVLYLMFLIYMLLEYNEKSTKAEVQKQINYKIRRYIVLKTAISLLAAVSISIILAAFTVPVWLLIGLIVFFLNFIPNVGSTVAALVPVPAIILDASLTWWEMLIAILLVWGVQIFISNVVDPKVMGRTFQLSAVSVIVSLAFWGGVWGIVGAIISIPMTVIIHEWLAAFDHPITQLLADIISGEVVVSRYADIEHKVPPEQPTK